ncbi:hypothetical protein SLEP1_g6458 [Rubroshorea leprosula]|uniref:GDSL esterase/lipase n=1 Tax=Rubroshorea leprosula TaxID=152421 RepID=A0AAV5I153_9ROSI|nr:hypothetical protein SLEP1_g6458 [Rubroshorea leprosula]
MAISLRLHICLLLLFTSFLNLIICYCPGEDHVPLFIFGDSYLDSGNNNYFNTTAKANFYPYGETFFNYSTGRYSDGRLISDFVAAYADLLFLPPYLQGNKQYTYGVNFASSGAGALYGTFRSSVKHFTV